MALDNDGLNIIITGDASQVIKELENTEKAIANIKGSQIKVTADSSQAVEEAEKVVNVVDSVNDGHIKITADSSQAVDAVDKVADTADSISDAHLKITADSAQAVDEAGKAADALDNVGDKNAVITADGSQASDEAAKVQSDIDSISDKEVILRVKVSNKEWLNSFNSVLNGSALKLSDSFNNTTGIFSGKVAEINGALGAIGKSLDVVFGTLFKTITKGASAVAGSLGMITKSALAIGGGFEAQMTSVKVISGATEAELDALTKKAREMGATLPISARDSAVAMTLLVQRGTSVKDVLASVEDVANLAISQGTTMANAADLLGSTITNFGLAMEDASKVTAMFNNASNQSALTMGKLTEALKYVGPTAGSIGMELSEVLSAMEAVTNAGLTGEMTGTGLAMVITKLASKTRIMGVETKDAQGKLRPLADIFSELKAKGFGVAEATAEFGARGRLAALNLAKLSDTLIPGEERLKNWGSTQAAVNEKAKTFTNTMAAFRSAMEELHIEIFEQIKTQSKEAVSGITELVRTLSEWIGQTKIAEQVLHGFLKGLGFNIPTGDNLKKLLEQIDTDAFVEKFRTLGSTIKSIAESIASFVSKIQTPLLFLIKNLDTFATISFWSWLGTKALQLPLALVNLAAGFIRLHSALNALSLLNLSGILAFLSSPVLWGVAGIAAVGTIVYKRVAEVQDAYEQLHQAEEKELQYLQEQAKADKSLDVDIKLNMKTGFEKLPEAWAKASDKLREDANQDIKALQDKFSMNVVMAAKAVIAEIPDMADPLNEFISKMDDASLRQLTQALQGNQEAFKALPDFIKLVVEQLNYMDVRAGQATDSVGKLIIAWKEMQEKAANHGVSKSELTLFAEEISKSVQSLVETLPDNIGKFQNFLNGHNLQLGVELSLAQANKQIEEVSKSLAEKFNIPSEIVSSAVFSQLQKLADKGSKTAQSLVNGWKGAGSSLDIFIQSAQDAVKYLGASPEKFTPALNSLSKGIQKIDPLTGKVTEQFKKAYDALKQWGNITFDQLSQRIQRLRKAVEGGFIDQSALEAEFKRASEQVKVKIAADLEPTRESYKSDRAFNSVVASEYFARMGELGGQAFIDLVQKEFAGLYDQSGSAIGAAIMRQVNKGLSSKGTLKVNGVDMSSQTGSKSLSEAVNPLISKLEQLGDKQISAGQDVTSRFPEIIAAINKLHAGIENNSSVITRSNTAMLSLVNSIGNIGESKSQTVIKDYSSEIAQVIKEIQNVSSGISALQSLSQANVNAVRDLQNNSASIDASAVVQAVTESLSPFVARIETSSSSYSAASDKLADNIFTLGQAVSDNNNALASLQNSMNGASSENTQNIDLAPLVNSVQSLMSVVVSIQGINKANASAVADVTRAVKAVESAVKSIQGGGSTYNIDINQQGFMIQKKSDADMLARNTFSAFRTGLGNGGV